MTQHPVESNAEQRLLGSEAAQRLQRGFAGTFDAETIARMETTPMDHKPAVLFLCVHNAGRSQMAAGWLRHLAGDRVEVFSGGSNPGEHVNPAAVEAMSEIGIDIAAEHPKPWTADVVRAVDVIISMGCGDACPVLPGKRYEDWELVDPAGQPVEVVREVRDHLRIRVEALVTSLDLAEPAGA